MQLSEYMHKFQFLLVASQVPFHYFALSPQQLVRLQVHSTTGVAQAKKPARAYTLLEIPISHYFLLTHGLPTVT